ncbi:MAG: hypothetical protein ACUVWX_08245 [Kiritimatiellia bacterium]
MTADGQQQRTKSTRFKLRQQTVHTPTIKSPATQYGTKALQVAQRINRRRRVHVAFGAVVLLGIMGIATAIVVKNYRREQARVERERAEALQARLMKVSALTERVSAVVQKASDAEREIRIMADKAAQAVVFVLAEGEEEEPKAKQPEPIRQESGTWVHPRPDDRPPGDLSYAELEALRRGRTPTPQPAQPKTVRSEREIERLQRQLSADADTAAAEGKAAGDLEVAAATLRDRAQASRDFDVIDENLTLLEKRVADAAEIESRIEELLTAARQRLARVEEIRAVVAKAREERIAEQERAKKERERLARIRRETELVRKTSAEAAELLKINAWRRALELLTTKRDECETEEGRAAFELPVARYTLIARLYEYVLEQLAKEQLPWGWIQDGHARDVLGADERELSVTGKKVPWSSVTSAQFFYLVKRLVVAPRLPNERLGELNLGAAALAYELEGNKVAATFAEQALAASPALRSERERLLPPDLAASADKLQTSTSR